MAKITAVIKRIEYHTVDIDTDEYHDSNNKGIKKVIELYNDIRENPCDWSTDDPDETEVEIQSIDIEE